MNQKDDVRILYSVLSSSVSMISKPKSYEELMGNILQFLFSPHISNMQHQLHVISNKSEYNLIFLNRRTHPFWEMVFEKHQAERILFNVRNILALKQNTLIG